MRAWGEILSVIVLIALWQFMACGVRVGDGRHCGGNLGCGKPLDWGVK